MREFVTVSIVYATCEEATIIEINLPIGSTVADAMTQADQSGCFPSEERESMTHAIFGQRAEPATPLHDGDRIELLRPLRGDPKESRRQRAQAARTKD